VKPNLSATLLASSGLALVVAAYLQLADQVDRADTGTSYGEALAPTRMWQFLTQPAEPGSWVSSGTLILGQDVLLVVVAGLLAALFVSGVRRGLDTVAMVAAPLAVTASLVTSLPTNLRDETFDDVLGAVMTHTHIIGGCTWVGGLAGLALLSRTRRALGTRAGATSFCSHRVSQRNTRPVKWEKVSPSPFAISPPSWRSRPRSGSACCPSCLF
jgi:copper transport protein